MAFTRRTNSQSIAWFADQHRTNKLNLDPPYQRGSEVWSKDYKDYFVDTILRDYPSPTIFLHVETESAGRTSYHVVDGKQRLTTIFAFASDQFPVSDKYGGNLAGTLFSELPPDVKIRFWEYEMPVQLLQNADPKDLKEAFDRLNRNVMRLSRQELRHARFSGKFINVMQALADDPVWDDIGISTKARIRRMADVEFVSEVFLLTMHGILDGSASVIDDYYAAYDEEIPDEDRHRRQYEATKKAVMGMGANFFVTTRFRNLEDFYSLWSAFRLLPGKASTIDYEKTRRKLVAFAKKVDDIPQSDQPADTSTDAARYSNAIRQGSNKKANRELRADILKALLVLG